MGNPGAHNLSNLVYNRVLNQSLGTKNVFSASTVDQMPKQVSAGLMFGAALSVPVADVDRMDYLVIMGANPYASNGSLMTAPDLPGRLEALRRAGGTVVVVDPRRSQTAEKSDEHLFIRPGTDAHFLFGVVNVLVTEGLVSLGRCEGLVDGLDEVERLAPSFTPEVVAPVCGIDADVIRRIARDLAGTERAGVYGRIGTCTQEFGTLASWLVDVVNVLAGNLDRPGGMMFALPGHRDHADRRRAPARDAGCASAAGTAASSSCPSSSASIRWRRWPTRSSRPARARSGPCSPSPGIRSSRRPTRDASTAALGTLEFMVSIDIYRNETTRHADVILPAPRVLTKSHYDLALYSLAVRNVANYSPPVIDLAGDEVPEWETMLRLAALVAGQGSSIDGRARRSTTSRSSRSCRRPSPVRGAPIEGRDAGELVEELSAGGRRGPERVLDLMLRTGPYGDQFGAPGHEGGISLAVLEANPHGVDLGPLQPRLARGAADPDRQDRRSRPTRSSPTSRRGSSRRSTGAPTGRWCSSAAGTCGRTTRGCTTSRSS